jgi:hypothetical protein
MHSFADKVKTGLQASPFYRSQIILIEKYSTLVKVDKL